MHLRVLVPFVLMLQGMRDFIDRSLSCLCSLTLIIFEIALSVFFGKFGWFCLIDDYALRRGRRDTTNGSMTRLMKCKRFMPMMTISHSLTYFTNSSYTFLSRASKRHSSYIKSHRRNCAAGAFIGSSWPRLRYANAYRTRSYSSYRYTTKRKSLSLYTYGTRNHKARCIYTTSSSRRR